MRVSLALIIGFVVALAAPLAFAQPEGGEGEAMEMPTPPPPPEDALMDSRVGSWTGTGTMMGMPVTESVTFSWQLNHHFVVSQSNMTMTMPDGADVPMEMHMVTKPNGDGTYTGMYMDTWGMMGPFTGHLDDSGNMVTEWTDPMEGDNHRAVDVNNEGGGWTMTFYSQGEDGVWVESGSMTYTAAAE